MPNHVTHRMLITGATAVLAAFKATHIVPDKDEPGRAPILDFNTILPMPDILLGSESSSVVHYGLMILGRGELWDNQFSPKTLEATLHDAWVVAAGITTVEVLKEHLIEKNPDCVAKAERAIEAHKQTGHINWYGWSIEHWGTKWNSYSFEVVTDDPRQLEIKFETAWASPEPIFEKLAALYPSLTFSIAAFDEGWNFAYVASLRDGALKGGCVEANALLHELVYGELPELNDEDEEEPAVATA